MSRPNKILYLNIQSIQKHFGTQFTLDYLHPSNSIHRYYIRQKIRLQCHFSLQNYLISNKAKDKYFPPTSS